MIRTIKTSLVFLFILNLAACSYSPSSLKETYNNLPSDLSEEFKDSIDLTSSQSAKVDVYTKQIMQWHRHNKLPQYAHTLARLAILVKEENIRLDALQKSLDEIENIPHFEQATHLTHNMAAVARTLTTKQITQLEQYLKDEVLEEPLEIRKEKLYIEESNEIKMMLRIIGISISDEQFKTVKRDAKKLHDIRWQELDAEKKSNMQLISLLRKKNNPEFVAQFARLWDQQSPALTGRAHQQKQQNRKTRTLMLKNLIMSFSPQQKENLSIQLYSLSDTFSEMANE